MSTMPFFTMMPIRMRMPTNAMEPKAVPVLHKPKNSPVKVKGMENMMTKGFIRFSNCADDIWGRVLAGSGTEGLSRADVTAA